MSLKGFCASRALASLASLLLVTAVLLRPTSTHAIQFDLIDANTQLVMLDDGAVDTAIRAWAFRNAKHSIDQAVYAQAADDKVGAVLLKELRRAADRGVTERVMYDKLVSWYLDKGKVAEKTLSHPNIDVMSIGPIRKVLHGLSATDFFHGKITIVDRGTPGETIIFGGRNNDPYQRDWHDFAFVMRPIDPGKPYLGTQLRTVFDLYWASVHQIQKEPSSIKVKPSLLERIDATPSSPEEMLSDSGLATFKEATSILSEPASKRQVSPIVVYPETGAAVTNDFIENALTGSHGRSINSRRKTMSSDIIWSVIDAINDAESVTISSMVPWFPMRLNAAIYDMVERGGALKLYTNGKEAQAPTDGLAYKLVAPELADLTHIPGAKERVQIYGFMPGSVQPGGNGHPLDFSHQKLVICKMKDGTYRVFVGSDNMNELGRTKQEEIMLELRGSQIGKYMTEKMERDSSMFKLIPHDEIRKDAAMPVKCLDRIKIELLKPLL
jgi:phosphatidylserine/phosphatidylglycerophosphate/cardiolipin synthase-like enzyme